LFGRLPTEEDATMADVDQTVSFEAQIKPLFREKDRDSMSRAFDLWSYGSVSEHADAISGALHSGKMPCDGAWPENHIELFDQWVEGGKKP
jgi:hypothetical protein